MASRKAKTSSTASYENLAAWSLEILYEDAREGSDAAFKILGCEADNLYQAVSGQGLQARVDLTDMDWTDLDGLVYLAVQAMKILSEDGSDVAIKTLKCETDKLYQAAGQIDLPA